MPAFGNIAAYDGASTPVLHTYAPEAVNGLEASYVDRSTGISLGFSRLKIGMQLAERNKPLNKVRVRFSIPKLETVSGSTEAGLVPAPRLAYVGSFDGTFIFHERATVQEREDLRVLLCNILTTATLIDIVDQLAPVY